MTRRRFFSKPPTDLTSDLGEGDGFDPRFDPRQSGRKVGNRKALQLCRQVEHALSMALEGDVLRDLTVQSVMPAPDSTRLLVTLVFHGVASITSEVVLAALHSQHAKLRRAIAAAIHRKKTPDFSFLVIRPSEPEA